MVAEVISEITGLIQCVSMLQDRYTKRIEAIKITKGRCELFFGFSPVSITEVGLRTDPEIIYINQDFFSALCRIKEFLRTIVILRNGKKRESGIKYAGILEAELAGRTLEQRIKTTIKFLRGFTRKDILFLSETSEPDAPKTARDISITDSIRLAKANVNEPEISINHVRTAINLIIYKKFGFDVKSVPRFTQICNNNDVQIPRFLQAFYDLGSKNSHRGHAPSSSDIRSAIVFVEGFKEELNQNPISSEKIEAIRKKCEKERILFEEADANSGAMDASNRQRALYSTKPRRILLLDDDENIFFLIQSTLGDGFEFMHCVNGDETLGRIAEFKPELVILDVFHPGLDGVNVCRSIKTNPNTVNLPVILISALDYKGKYLISWKESPDYYIRKPFSPSVLRSLVKHIFKQPLAHEDSCELQRLVNAHKIREGKAREEPNSLFDIYGIIHSA